VLASFYLDDSENFASLPRKFGSGHHQKYNRDHAIAAIKEIRFQKRTMCRKLVSALNLPKSFGKQEKEMNNVSALYYTL